MTTLYIVTADAPGYLDGMRAFATQNEAKTECTNLRKEGIDTQLDAVDLAELLKKPLLCALFNHEDYAANVNPVQTLKGVKSPKVGA